MGEKHYLVKEAAWFSDVHGTPYAYNPEEDVIVLRPYNVVFQEMEGPLPKDSIFVSFDKEEWAFKGKGNIQKVYALVSYHYMGDMIRDNKWVDASRVIIPEKRELIIELAKSSQEKEQKYSKMWASMSDKDRSICLSKERVVSTPLLKEIMDGNFGDSQEIISSARGLFKKRYSGAFERFSTTPK